MEKLAVALPSPMNVAAVLLTCILALILAYLPPKVEFFQALSWSRLVRKLCPVGVLIYINITVSYCRILTLKFSLKFIHLGGGTALGSSYSNYNYK